MQRMREELVIDFKELTSEPDLKLVNRDYPYELWLATFEDRDPVTNDRVMKTLIWDQNEVHTFDYYNAGLREYTSIQKERRKRTNFELLTAPLTIGASIGILLVLVMAVQLFWGTDTGLKRVPDQLWSILTAVIAFYFGRGSVGNQRTGSRSEDDQLAERARPAD
jgi:hypothetical protein